MASKTLYYLNDDGSIGSQSSVTMETDYYAFTNFSDILNLHIKLNEDIFPYVKIYKNSTEYYCFTNENVYLDNIGAVANSSAILIKKTDVYQFNNGNKILSSLVALPSEWTLYTGTKGDIPASSKTGGEMSDWYYEDTQGEHLIYGEIMDRMAGPVQTPRYYLQQGNNTYQYKGVSYIKNRTNISSPNGQYSNQDWTIGSNKVNQNKNWTYNPEYIPILCYSNQNEVIDGSSTPDTITLTVNSNTIIINGETYDYDSSKDKILVYYRGPGTWNIDSSNSSNAAWFNKGGYDDEFSLNFNSSQISIYPTLKWSGQSSMKYKTITSTSTLSSLKLEDTIWSSVTEDTRSELYTSIIGVADTYTLSNVNNLKNVADIDTTYSYPWIYISDTSSGGITRLSQGLKLNISVQNMPYLKDYTQLLTLNNTYSASDPSYQASDVWCEAKVDSSGTTYGHFYMEFLSKFTTTSGFLPSVCSLGKYNTLKYDGGKTGVYFHYYTNENNITPTEEISYIGQIRQLYALYLKNMPTDRSQWNTYNQYYYYAVVLWKHIE